MISRSNVLDNNESTFFLSQQEKVKNINVNDNPVKQEAWGPAKRNKEEHKPAVAVQNNDNSGHPTADGDKGDKGQSAVESDPPKAPVPWDNTGTSNVSF